MDLWLSVGASGFEPPISWSRNGDRVSRRTTECSTNAVFWAVGVVPRELRSLRSSEKLTPKLTPRATSWTDFRMSLSLHGLGAQTLRPPPPLAQCHLLATTKRCDRPKDVTPVMGLEPATPEPHANRQRIELRLSSRARLSPSTRGTNRAADGGGRAGWRSGRGTPCRTGHPGARSPGASPASQADRELIAVARQHHRSGGRVDDAEMDVEPRPHRERGEVAEQLLAAGPGFVGGDRLRLQPLAEGQPAGAGAIVVHVGVHGPLEQVARVR